MRRRKPSRAELAPTFKAQRGFTLIELLVVLVILGSLIGLAVLSTGIAGPARELRSEAERLSGLIGVLVDEAVLDNREYGLSFTREGYRVLRYDPQRDEWQALDRQAHRLPEWAELAFEVDGEALSLTTEASADAPQLLILSSGELTPFRLRLAERQRDGLRLQLSSDGFGLPRVEELGTGRAR
ncbi:type II secretion system minor pseudopilin GspH [Pseudomonas chengduensis]|jgi:general secretion pathway protein H|nr:MULTISPECIES: type II secretion system minor pseudopilin GspH [Pseudomonas]MAE22341.1 type II secretion system protein GspH [Pseudomonas sp.]MDH0622009.1 type II secretion system minor pseudopilin GspH [Pseudomonas chengduensis]MDH1210352.1 type II secretion system minor pseudopilin GspH [Pseudomonas chengduensis]MDH1664265.1 type II secretion system minor pseudopilin GspH [Pseudomonas chengduensis]MDH1680140.1 type II secretion system minor pseudopilin GspH [Pseudomonas chengduensis]|tara:strand:+ start:753 stop:1304 length:552 start_codon:yes stop_codon:yes gene_type:complete